MTLALNQGESAAKGLRRLLRRELKKTEEASSVAPADADVHDLRKRCKKMRSLLRLLRERVGERRYRDENARLRDASRPLSEVRDAKILADTLDKLIGPERTSFASARRMLLANQNAVREQVLEQRRALPAVSEEMTALKKRMRDWPRRASGWRSMRRGLRRLYRQGRRALAEVNADRSVENLHEWRKQVKYLWQSLRVLEHAWDNALGPLAEEYHRLGQLLGDDHDLVVLSDRARREVESFGGVEVVRQLTQLIDQRRRELQDELFERGRRLYGEPPAAFIDRLSALWRVWRSE
jgi:CHAD domain-containing protein